LAAVKKEEEKKQKNLHAARPFPTPKDLTTV
jgi:hypothetical protein